MQAHPAQALARPTATTPTVTGALRAVEAILLAGGQQTARRNAWTAVLEDRRRARDRHEAQHALEGLAAAQAVPPGSPWAPTGTARG